MRCRPPRRNADRICVTVNPADVANIIDILTTSNPERDRLHTALVIVWNTQQQGDLETIATGLATPTDAGLAVVCVAADPCANRWRAPHRGWTPTNTTSAAVATTIAQGLPPAAGITLADRIADWRHDPALADAVAPHLGATWAAHTLTTRADIVDDVWAVMVASNEHPEPDAIAATIDALNGPTWLRDTLMLRACHHWNAVVETLRAATRAATATATANVAATAANAAYFDGHELDGTQALERARHANPAHSLTALLNEAKTSGHPMTRTVRAVFTDMTETDTLTAALP